MKRKIVFFSELAYIFGIIILAFGTALMERANLGISMVVAPAYLLHLKVSQVLPRFTFGVAEYVLQAVVLILLSIIRRKAKVSYLFSFLTAVFYGSVLDLFILFVGAAPNATVGQQFLLYLSGMILCAVGVALLFHTYIAPEAYELFVKEVSSAFGFRIDRVKTAYDCCSCLLGVALSFLFFGFGQFEGVKLGTIFCALVNGWFIGIVSRGLDAAFLFRDALPFRPVFDR